MRRIVLLRLVASSIALAGTGCSGGTAAGGNASPAVPGSSDDATPLDADQKALLDGTRQIAAKLLRELGAFPPVALALDPHGKTLLVTLSDVAPQTPEPKKIELLARKLKALADKGAIRAVGIVVNGELAGDDGTRHDTLIISVEERARAPRGFAVAYRMTGKRVAFAEPTPLRARAVVFPAP